jgi:hypothetical protein
MSFAHAAVLSSDLMTQPMGIPFQNTDNIGLIKELHSSTPKRNHQIGMSE